MHAAAVGRGVPADLATVVHGEGTAFSNEHAAAIVRSVPADRAAGHGELAFLVATGTGHVNAAAAAAFRFVPADRAALHGECTIYDVYTRAVAGGPAQGVPADRAAGHGEAAVIVNDHSAGIIADRTFFHGEGTANNRHAAPDVPADRAAGHGEFSACTVAASNVHAVAAVGRPVPADRAAGHIEGTVIEYPASIAVRPVSGDRATVQGKCAIQHYAAASLGIVAAGDFAGPVRGAVIHGQRASHADDIAVFHGILPRQSAVDGMPVQVQRRGHALGHHQRALALVRAGDVLLQRDRPALGHAVLQPLPLGDEGGRHGHVARRHDETAVRRHTDRFAAGIGHSEVAERIALRRGGGEGDGIVLDSGSQIGGHSAICDVLGDGDAVHRFQLRLASVVHAHAIIVAGAFEVRRAAVVRQAVGKGHADAIMDDHGDGGGVGQRACNMELAVPVHIHRVCHHGTAGHVHGARRVKDACGAS